MPEIQFSSLTKCNCGIETFKITALVPTICSHDDMYYRQLKCDHTYCSFCVTEKYFRIRTILKSTCKSGLHILDIKRGIIEIVCCNTVKSVLEFCE